MECQDNLAFYSSKIVPLSATSVRYDVCVCSLQVLLAGGALPSYSDHLRFVSPVAGVAWPEPSGITHSSHNSQGHLLELALTSLSTEAALFQLIGGRDRTELSCQAQWWIEMRLCLWNFARAVTTVET